MLAACTAQRRKCRTNERGQRPSLASSFFLPGKLTGNLLCCQDLVTGFQSEFLSNDQVLIFCFFFPEREGRFHIV